MQSNTLHKREDYRFEEAAKALGIDAQKLETSGEIDRMLRTGVSSPLKIRLESQAPGRDTVVIETTARLTLGVAQNGSKAVRPVLKASELDTGQYAGVRLTDNQSERLEKGENVLVRNPGDGREYITRVDHELNRVTGWAKSNIMVPERIGREDVGYGGISRDEQAALKRGEPVQVSVGGRAYVAQVDPVRRELIVSRGIALDKSLNQNIGDDVNGEREVVAPSVERAERTQSPTVRQPRLSL